PVQDTPHAGRVVRVARKRTPTNRRLEAPGDGDAPPRPVQVQLVAPEAPFPLPRTLLADHVEGRSGGERGHAEAEPDAERIDSSTIRQLTVPAVDGYVGERIDPGPGRRRTTHDADVLAGAVVGV